MKINKIIILTSFIICFFTQSCKDSFLEDLPNSEILLNEDAIKTVSDLENAVNGLYGIMNGTVQDDGTNILTFAALNYTYQELTGDIAFVSSKNSGRFVTTNSWNHILADGGAGGVLWNDLYKMIAHTNLILGFEGKINTENESEDILVKQYFANARAVRAYSYFILSQYFCPAYGTGDPSLGLPYPTTYDIYAKLPRIPLNEVYDNIINDLLEAKEGIANVDEINTFNNRSVNLLLARVYLFKKDYQKAIDYATEVRDSSILLPFDKVSTFFTAGGEASETDYETLFRIQMTSPILIGTNDAISATWAIAGAYKQNFMTRDFWETIPTTGTALQYDARRAWYQNSTAMASYPDTPLPIEVKKYVTNSRDVIQFRATESIFIIAESLYHLGQESLAAETLQDWVKEYRQKNYNIATSLSGDALLDEILRQKAIEFFLEGQRFSDLKRNHKPVIKPQTNLNISADDYRFVWPIPRNEMDTNPNMVQNPGY